MQVCDMGGYRRHHRHNSTLDDFRIGERYLKSMLATQCLRLPGRSLATSLERKLFALSIAVQIVREFANRARDPIQVAAYPKKSGDAFRLRSR